MFEWININKFWEFSFGEGQNLFGRSPIILYVRNTYELNVILITYLKALFISYLNVILIIKNEFVVVISFFKFIFYFSGTLYCLEERKTLISFFITWFSCSVWSKFRTCIAGDEKKLFVTRLSEVTLEDVIGGRFWYISVRLQSHLLASGISSQLLHLQGRREHKNK